MNMTRAIGLSVIVFSLTMFASAHATQNESEAQTLIKSVRFLEVKPLDKQAKDVRGWAVGWVIKTDQVSVSICAGLLNGLGKKYKYESELLGQYTIGMAAFKLSNPAKASDEDAAQLAGFESVLLSYEAIKKDQPKAQNAYLDDLLARRTNNTLAEYLITNNCSKEKK